jgi:hypothetical protein
MQGSGPCCVGSNPTGAIIIFWGGLMRKLLAFLFALAILVSFVSARWSENVSILVQDLSNRPIPNAQVTLTWQLSENKYQNMTKATDYMGITFFNITDYTTYESQTNYTVYAFAEYGVGALYASKAVKFSAKGYPNPMPVNLTLYKVRVTAYTQYGTTLPDAIIYISPWTIEADLLGSAVFILPPKSTTVVAALGDAQGSKTFTVKGDMQVNVTVNAYRLTIHVVDQLGSSRNGIVRIDNRTYSTNPEGIIRFLPFPGTWANITVKTGDKEKQLNVQMNQDREAWAVFDSAAPKILDLARTNIQDGKKSIVAKISDEGQYASGIASVSLAWWVNAVSQQELEMYPQDKETFTVTLPAQPENTEVSYMLKATDKEGNVAFSKKETYGKTIIEPPINQTQGNQTASNNGFSIDFGGINLWYIIGGAAFLVIAILAYIYMKED